MLSSVPVSSPTAVIWTTMGGNRPLDCRGTAILSPSRMLLRTLSMACDTTLFSTALATTSSACMIGTPLLISVPRVRVKREMVTFRMYINTSAGRGRVDKFKLRGPAFGPLVRKVTISRFTRTLGTLISSGVPIMQALEVVAKAVENKVVSQAIESVRSSIREGESIALPLQSSGLFPPMVVQMTAVGEETGTLDSMLQKVADFYDAEVETTLAQLTSILEPILIMFLGFVVGFIVLSFYMPLYQLITGIK